MERLGKKVSGELTCLEKVKQNQSTASENIPLGQHRL